MKALSKALFCILPVIGSILNILNIFVLAYYAYTAPSYHKEEKLSGGYHHINSRHSWVLIGITATILILSLRHRLIYCIAFILEEKRVKLAEPACMLYAYIPLFGPYVLLDDMLFGELLTLFIPFAFILNIAYSLFCSYVYIFRHPTDIYKRMDEPVVAMDDSPFKYKIAFSAVHRVLLLCQVMTETFPLLMTWVYISLNINVGHVLSMWLWPSVITANSLCVFQYTVQSVLYGNTFTPMSGFSHKMAEAYDRYGVLSEIRYERIQDIKTSSLTKKNSNLLGEANSETNNTRDELFQNYIENSQHQLDLPEISVDGTDITYGTF